MDIQSYTAALREPLAWQAMRWLNEVVNPQYRATEIRFDPTYGSPEAATLHIGKNENRIVTDTPALTVTATFTPQGTPALNKSGTDVLIGISQFAHPNPKLVTALLSLTRCLGIPPRRDVGHVMYAMDALETSLQLGWEMSADLQAQGREVDWRAIAYLVQKIEDLAGLHHKACTQALDSDNNDAAAGEWWESDDDTPSRLDQLETQIQRLLDLETKALAISPMIARFSRDPRGLTMRLTERSDQSEWKSKLSYRGKEFVPGYHPLREKTLGLCESAKHLWTMLAPTTRFTSKAKAPTTESTDATPKAKSAAKSSRLKNKLDKALSTVEASTRAPTTECPEDVLTILRNGHWAEHKGQEVFFLPDGQLDRKLYEQLRDFIAAAEGKWVTKLKGFSFVEGGADRMRAAIKSGEIVDPKDLGFFPTPEAEADALAQTLDLKPGMRVYEPSAGRGALARAAAKIVGIENVVCSEFLEHNAENLRQQGFEVHVGDFLQMSPATVGTFDRIIMNPPFGKGADLKHIKHACQFLNDGGRLGSILSPGFTFREDSAAKDFRALIDQAGQVEKELAAGTFKESGTMVRTVVITLEADQLPETLRGKQRAATDALPPSVEQAAPIDITAIDTMDDESTEQLALRFR